MVEIKVEGQFTHFIDRSKGAKTIADMQHLETLLNNPTYFARTDLGLGNYTIITEERMQVAVEPDDDCRGVHLSGHTGIIRHSKVKEDFEEYKMKNREGIEENLKMYRDIKKHNLSIHGWILAPDKWTEAIKKYNIRSLTQLRRSANTRIIDGEVVPFLGCFKKGKSRLLPRMDFQYG